VSGSDLVLPAGVYWNAGVGHGVTVYPDSGFVLMLRSYGYRTSPRLTLTPEDLYATRDQTPVMAVILEPEHLAVTLTDTGTNQSGEHVFAAQLTYSEFVEETIASFGGTESDAYSFYVEYKLVSLEPRPNPYPVIPAPGAEDIAYDAQTLAEAEAPYDPAAVQTMDGYTALSGNLTVSSDEYTVLLDSTVKKGMEIYIEILALAGDGDSTIDGSEELLGFQSETLLAANHQITIQ
jgi:hypothetical protein